MKEKIGKNEEKNETKNKNGKQKTKMGNEKQKWETKNKNGKQKKKINSFFGKKLKNGNSCFVSGAQFNFLVHSEF
jgi:hypothetical protein